MIEEPNQNNITENTDSTNTDQTKILEFDGPAPTDFDVTDELDQLDGWREHIRDGLMDNHYN